jgi:hypothetical protein
MFYSILLAMTANAILVELGVRQLASRIPFEGMAPRRGEFVQIGKPFYIENRLLKKIVTVDLKL